MSLAIQVGVIGVACERQMRGATSGGNLKRDLAPSSRADRMRDGSPAGVIARRSADRGAPGTRPRPRNRHTHTEVRWGKDHGAGGFTCKGSRTPAPCYGRPRIRAGA